MYITVNIIWQFLAVRSNFCATQSIPGISRGRLTCERISAAVCPRMWWDERFANFDGAVIEAEGQLRSAASTNLAASLALESEYVRCEQHRVLLLDPATICS